MPPEDTGINFAVTFKQFVVGVISVCGTVIATAWFVMSTYMPASSHIAWETKVDHLHDNAVTSDTHTKAVEDLKEDHDVKLNQLKKAIQDAEERQLLLQRGILKSFDSLTKQQKKELEQIEEAMIRQGYLNPSLRTDTSRIPTTAQ